MDSKYLIPNIDFGGVDKSLKSRKYSTSPSPDIETIGNLGISIFISLVIIEQ